MSDEITVRPLGVDDWEQYKAVRLSALEESPEAFVATYDEEKSYEEDLWRKRMQRSERLLAENGNGVVGVASVGTARPVEDEDNADGLVGELFGLWVSPAARGTGVATRLVRAGAEAAKGQGRSHLVYWVGSDNGRAVAFASGFGFRPTDYRRPMRVKADDSEEEIAMILPLGEDRAVPTLRV
jgi:ribosomal protein S18 acetylase RimI-like enzyme